MRKRGRVVRWNAERGFGFLRAADSQADVFFHVRDVRGGDVHEGLEVIYEEIHVGGKGPRGMAVRPVARQPDAAAAAGGPADGVPAARTTFPAYRPLRPADASPGRRDPSFHDRAGASVREDTGQRLPGGAPPPRPAGPLHAVGATRPRPQARPTDAAARLKALLPLTVVYAALLVWAAWTRRLPVGLVLASPLLNAATFWAYWQDKTAARRGAWRTREDHLHALSLAGGWIGAGVAQALLRHKSRKASFRAGWWASVALHWALLLGVLAWRGGAAG